jgi:hypothetical protein
MSSALEPMHEVFIRFWLERFGATMSRSITEGTRRNNIGGVVSSTILSGL